MPIPIKQYDLIKERKIKSDRELLDFMEMDREYTTNDVQRFLEINHTATLQRLKKLRRLEFIKLINKKIYFWSKIKDMPEKDDTRGYKFY